MTVVVLGIDALDEDLLDEKSYPNLTLTSHKSIDTISSSDTGKPSTHELWPTIITGLPPEEHGLQLTDGIAWDSPLLNLGSTLSNYILPKSLQVKLGAWVLDNTNEAAFRARATYYQENGLSTVFDGFESTAIGIPNYVVNPTEKDREHELRNDMADMFKLDVDDETDHTHVSSDPWQFYEYCLEMAMIRIARSRRALRGRNYELVFSYTSALDLIGHIAYNDPSLQKRAYEELNHFVGELRSDLTDEDELLLVSDHGLQNGTHTDKAAVAGTNGAMVDHIHSVLDVRKSIETELQTRTHLREDNHHENKTPIGEGERGTKVKEHLEDLGYM